MWTTERKTSAPWEEGAELGVVTIGGNPAAVETRGEVRNLPVFGPGGYVWMPRRGQRVLVLKGGPGGEEQCVAAAEQEEQTLGLNPADPEGWEMLSSLYLQTEDLDKAEDAIIRSLHYYPDNPRQHLVLGSIYGMRGDNDSCMAQLDKALKLTPAEDVELISRIYTSMGDNMYQQQLPDSSYVYYSKAITYDQYPCPQQLCLPHGMRRQRP